MIVNPGTGWANISAMKFYLSKAQTPISGTPFTNALYPTRQLAYSGYGSDGNAYLYPVDVQLGPRSAAVFVKNSELYASFNASVQAWLCHN